MSPRKAGVLARELPDGAATWRTLDVATAWTPGEHLDAVLADVLQIANWQRGGGKGPRPKPLARPGQQPAKKVDRQSRQDRARAHAERYAARHAAAALKAEPAPAPPAGRKRDAAGRFVKEV